MTTTYTRERALQDEIAPAIERRLPEVEVLAVELLSPSRFCVYIDHPRGVDHALCERVTYLLDDYRANFTIDVSSPGPERPLRKPAHFAAAVVSLLSDPARRQAIAAAARRFVVDHFDWSAVAEHLERALLDTTVLHPPPIATTRRTTDQPAGAS